MPYAHSSNADGMRHDLHDHLHAVADLAAEFASRFGATALGRYLGLWHDVGKLAPEFQRYLLAAEEGRRLPSPDHKAAGALLALEWLGALALPLQGHHGGLTSLSDCKAWLAEHRDAAARTLGDAHQQFPDLRPERPLALPETAASDILEVEVLLRLLYSALVDADYLDTERHFSPASGIQRTVGPSLEVLWQRFEADQARLTGHADDPVNHTRHAIYEACVAAAAQPPGLYRLTVPTGGGKTRSALAFALRHALTHGMERIIVAVPFLSITEQTVRVYRDILEREGEPPAVLEHHSAARFPDDEGDLAGWTRLAAENWDAPVVVTTTVQLFESLFANRPQAARKVHRLTHAVLLLDEVQALPPGRLTPILDALQRLSAYHTTVVLSTATQPAFEVVPGMRALDAREIVPQPERYFHALERVRYEWRLDEPLPWGDVVAEMMNARQAMAVVNTRRDAQTLHATLCAQDPEALHLSAAMCGLHKSRVIAEVRRRLAAGHTCRLVATQVVEAGVDLDFPLVLRALGPLDAIIQAAGRCNREGRLPYGRVVVFVPADGGLPLGVYRTATGITRAVLGAGDLDPNSPQAARPYYTRLFDTVDADSDDVQGCRRRLDYAETARRFRMIDDDAEPVVVPFGTTEERSRAQRALDDLVAHRGSPRSLWRALQPYTVSLPRRQVERARRDGLAADLAPGVTVWTSRYDARCGLLTGAPAGQAYIF